MVHPALGLSSANRRLLPEITKALQFFHKQKIRLDAPGMVWFQAMLAKPTDIQAEALAKRLMLSRDEQKIVVQHAKHYPVLLKDIASKKVTPSRMYRLLSPLVPEVQCFLLAAAKPAVRKKMKAYFTKMKNLKPWLRGRDLKQFGIPPGFRYSYILLEALNGQLDGRFKSRKEVVRWVRKAFVPVG
jgi:tRNA nucleotidyltransferase (CCA-adding enzyme)